MMLSSVVFAGSGLLALAIAAGLRGVVRMRWRRPVGEQQALADESHRQPRAAHARSPSVPADDETTPGVLWTGAKS